MFNWEYAFLLLLISLFSSGWKRIDGKVAEVNGGTRAREHASIEHVAY